MVADLAMVLFFNQQPSLAGGCSLAMMRAMSLGGCGECVSHQHPRMGASMVARWVTDVADLVMAGTWVTSIPVWVLVWVHVG